MKCLYFKKGLFTILFTVVLGAFCQAQIPQTPTVQMLLTDNSGKQVADGSYSITLALYNATTGGSSLWTETQNITVSDGLANIVLGKITPLGLDFNKKYYLGISIGGGSEMTPRLPLTPSAYSLSALAVYGSANIFPSSGDVGVGTLQPKAKVDINGKLRVSNVPLTNTSYSVVVHSVSDDIIKHVLIDSLAHEINKASWNYLWKWRGEENDTVSVFRKNLVVKNLNNDTVFIVYAEDGRSIHKGLEKFEKGIEVSEHDSNAGVTIDPKGIISIKDNNGVEVTRFNPDGTSVHNGLEVYNEGLKVSTNGGGIVNIGSAGITISDGDLGVGTLQPKAKVDINGKLRVADIPLIDTTYSVIVQSDSDSIIKHIIIDSLAYAINKASWKYLWEWRSKVTNDTTHIFKKNLVVKNSNNDTVFIVYAENGNSIHRGLEKFEKGIEVSKRDSKAGTTITSEGEILVKDANGKVVTRFKTDGTSMHGGLETFNKGLKVPTDGGGWVTIDSSGVTVTDGGGNKVTEFHPNGKSFHKKQELYEGGIKIPLKDGGYLVLDSLGVTVYDDLDSVKTKFNPDGTSLHNGLETYNKGIRILTTGGGWIDIDSTGVTITDGEGNKVTELNPDGTSHHEGTEVFAGGLWVGDPGTGAGTKFLPDGTTVIYGPEGNVSTRFYPDGTIIIYDSEGNEVTRFNPDGTSEHSGEETYSGGLVVSNPGESGVASGTRILPDGTIVIYDEYGVEVTRFSPDGTSFHSGLETYAGGLEIPLANGGTLRITPEGGIEIVDVEGHPVHTQSPDGTSFHSGLETFEDGIVSNLVETQNLVAAEEVHAQRLVADLAVETQTLVATEEVQTGRLIAAEKNFRIDHPLDPTNKYLVHASLESNERANIYNGNIVLDKDGKAEIDLPEWFDALNTNFRYQLTPIGAPCPNLFVVDEVKNNKFKIAGGKPNTKISWQVIGTRKDTYAINNPMQVEVEKNPTARLKSNK